MKIAKMLGGISGGFPHAFADIEYGFRANRSGVEAYQTPNHIGVCEKADPKYGLGVVQNWREFTGIKGGGNFKSLIMIYRAASSVSPLFWVTLIYTKWWFIQLSNKVIAWRPFPQ
jgi:hypothetical protein